jgi:hypothetical protein
MASDQEKELVAPSKLSDLRRVRPARGFAMSATILMVIEGNHFAED